MGIPVLVIGESGSGKSTSLRNFEAEGIGIFSVSGKPLPFRKKMNVKNQATYKIIKGRFAEKRKSPKAFAIDDSQYLMAFDFFGRAKENGFQKFTDIGLDFYSLIQAAIDLPEDVIVYFLHHSEAQNDGRAKAKTIGKMLDEKLTVEGLFSVVLFAKTDGEEYFFETQSDGFTTAKSPMGMFAEKTIDNDLLQVDTAIREYWALAPLKNVDEKGE